MYATQADRLRLSVCECVCDREEGLQREVRDLEQRCQAAEARHQDLAANIPEATRPLLRQLEAMQVRSPSPSSGYALHANGLISHAVLPQFVGSRARSGQMEALIMLTLCTSVDKCNGTDLDLQVSNSCTYPIEMQLVDQLTPFSTADMPACRLEAHLACTQA